MTMTPCTPRNISRGKPISTAPPDSYLRRRQKPRSPTRQPPLLTNIKHLPLSPSRAHQPQPCQKRLPRTSLHSQHPALARLIEPLPSLRAPRDQPLDNMRQCLDLAASRIARDLPREHKCEQRAMDVDRFLEGVWRRRSGLWDGEEGGPEGAGGGFG